jgi:integrase
MPKLSTVRRKHVDLSSGGKHSFERKKRKRNITVPLDEKTIDILNAQTKKYAMARCELMRNMIEFASKNAQFALLMEQL